MAIEAVTAARGYQALGKAPTADAGLGNLGERFAAAFDQADSAVKGFAAGRIDAQGVVEALAQAEMSLQTAVTVRDRVVGAYQELLRMPL